MVKEYKDGSSFLEENSPFLNENKFMTTFFFLDASLMWHTSKQDYIFKVEDQGNKLLALKFAHFNTLLYGNPNCLEELLTHLKENDFEIGDFSCATDIGDRLVDVAPRILGHTYQEKMGMDFLVATESSDSTPRDIEVPAENDLDELYDLVLAFYKECGLPMGTQKESLLKVLNNFRIIRRDGKIISFSCISVDTDISKRITHVYTRPDYRGRGYARQVVIAAKNDILSQSMKATLFVDQANPISYHLYESLGFTKVFSQGIYEKIN